MQLSDEATQAKEFFDFLFSGCPKDTKDNQALLAITQFRRKQTEEVKITTYYFTREDTAKAASIAINLDSKNRTNLYVRCTMMGSRPQQGRGDRTHTLGSSTLWVDADTKNTTKEKVLDRLKNHNPPPNIIHDSGSGYHAFWKLDTFLTDVKEIEERTFALEKTLKCDDCWASTQVLRIPGTRNWKNRDNPRFVKRVYASGEKPHSPDKFEKQPLPATIYETDFHEEALPENFLDDIPSNLANRITTGAGAPSKSDGSIDRSGNDWYIACTLLKLGYTLGQTLRVLTHPEWFSGGKILIDGYRYATHTVARAYANIQAITQTKTSGFGKEFLLGTTIAQLLFYSDEEGNKRKKPLLQGADLVEPCVDHLRDVGIKFYTDDLEHRAYIASPDGSVVSVDAEDVGYRDWIYSISGFTSDEKEHKVLRSGIASAVRLGGTSAKVTPWCYFDQNNEKFYIAGSRNVQSIYRIEPGKPAVAVPNGTDALLMLPSILQSQSIEYNPSVTPKEAANLMYDNITSWLACDYDTRHLLTCYAWALPLCYGSAVGTMPILHLIGNPGMGKSQTLGIISTFLHGENKLLNTTLAAAYRIASGEVLLPFDDYERISEEAKQFILTAATGIARQKSGKGTRDIVTQKAHVLMALTSINILEDEAARRRAFVIPIDRTLYKTPAYTEKHWWRIREARNSIWSGLMNLLSERLIRRMSTDNLMQVNRKIETLMPLSVFKGLSSFLSVMYFVAEELAGLDSRIITPEECVLETLIPKWCAATGIDSMSEITDRNPLVDGLASVFEMTNRGPEGETFQFRYDWREGEGYTALTKVIQCTLRDKDFRVATCPNEDIEDLQRDDPGNWVGLQGSTTEWLATIKAADRMFPRINAKSLGWMFTRVAGSPEIKTGFVFKKKKGIGARSAANGWAVFLKYPD